MPGPAAFASLGAYAVRTEYTGARWSATWVQLAPASVEPNTSPDVAPK